MKTGKVIEILQVMGITEGGGVEMVQWVEEEGVKGRRRSGGEGRGGQGEGKGNEVEKG